jgi:L-asparaginase II
VLRTMAGRFFAGQPQAVQADAIHTALERYAASAWARERALDACPDRHAGTVAACCWTVLRLRDSVPSSRHIRRILAMTPRW